MAEKKPFPDRRRREPPHGFELMTGADLDDEHGRADRWLYIGRVGRRSCIRANFKTHEEACLAAWAAFDGTCAVLTRGPYGAGMRAMQVDPPGMPDILTVGLDTWEAMTELLAQVVRAAGSIRRAARVIEVPKSTLAMWVRRHCERGTWPARTRLRCRRGLCDASWQWTLNGLDSRGELCAPLGLRRDLPHARAGGCVMAHAAINPEMLRWARHRAGLRIEDVQIPAGKRWLESLSDWESGNGGPTFEQARALSKIFHVPLGYLFLDSPPAIEVGVPDLRTIGDHGGTLTLDLTDTVLDAQHKQAWLSEYRKRHLSDPLPWVGSSRMADGPDAVAEKIRRVLDLDEGWRGEAKDWEELHRNLVLSAEMAGVIVLQSSMVGANSHRPLSVEDFRGFALVDKFAPLVFINTSDYKPARLFTLIHELTHLALSASGISNAPLAQEDVLPLPDIERFCNAVAAEFLMPRADLIRLWNKHQPFEANVRKLSLSFKISQLVAARGAFDAGLVSAKAYWPFVRERIQIAKDKADKLRESDGGPGGVTMARFRNGGHFVKLVTEAAKSGELLYRDAARLLNVKPVTLGKLGA